MRKAVGDWLPISSTGDEIRVSVAGPGRALTEVVVLDRVYRGLTLRIEAGTSDRRRQSRAPAGSTGDCLEHWAAILFITREAWVQTPVGSLVLRGNSGHAASHALGARVVDVEAPDLRTRFREAELL